MTNVAHTIEWTHFQTGDIGLRAIDSSEKPIKMMTVDYFASERLAREECARLNEHSESYHYRPVVYVRGMTPGPKVRGDKSRHVAVPA